MTVTIDIAAAFKALAVALFVGAVLAVLLLLVGKVRNFINSRRFDLSSRNSMKRRWHEILELARQPGEVSLKLAVMEADKLLDQALKTLAMPGNTLGERLKFAAYKYPQLQRVWWAHKIRNQLAHEASYHLDRSLGVKALKGYRDALKLLGAI